MKRIWYFVRFVFILSLLGLSSCSEDVENLYSGYLARFTYKYVNTVPPLYSALNSLGVFATIQADRGTYVFKDESGNKTTVNITAEDQNQHYYLGIAGFMVGLPNIPELGATTSTPVCYDLACPNCYENLHIQKTLTLEVGGFASCQSCGRVYNLNNQGLVSEGDGGISLYRYRMSYSGNTLMINNQ